VTPTLILLTGRKSVGKDCLSDTAKAFYPGQVRQIAVADWFKRALSEATSFELASFYDKRKEVLYRNPLVLSEDLIHRLCEAIASAIGPTSLQTRQADLGNLIEVMRTYKGTSFQSNRKLMEWLGFQFIHDAFGSDEVHCLVTEIGIRDLLARDPHCQYLIITDARTYYESSYFHRTWKGPVLRVNIQRPEVEKDLPSSDIELATAKFPLGWFDATFINVGFDEYRKDIWKFFQTLNGKTR